VIVPEPEVVFRYAKPACNTGAPTPACGDSGQIAFNMTFNMPMTATAGPLAGNNLLGLLGGMSANGGLGNSGLELQLLRALLTRSAAPAADNIGNTALADVQTQIRSLSSAMEKLAAARNGEEKKTNDELAKVLAKMNREVEQLLADVDVLRSKQGLPPRSSK
jgi:hypothetical protein